MSRELRRSWNNEKGERQVGIHVIRRFSSDPTSCLSFDRARLIRHHRYLAANGIDLSGKSHPNPVHDYFCSVSCRHASQCKGSHTSIAAFRSYL
jgi:hypothetical protein